MNIVGNGQLAKAFQSESNSDVVIFASGVSDSTCTDSNAFLRESQLLKTHLWQNEGKKFVYFSSCALSAEGAYSITSYYRHKLNMEQIVKQYSNNAYIFRIPQLFGCFTSHKTIINFFYESIINGVVFKVYDDAYRYLIHIDDVKKIVLAYLANCEAVCVDLANPYRYRVLDIIHDLEYALDRDAKYELINKTDKYDLDLKDMLIFMNEHNLELGFGEDYFRRKLINHFMQSHE